MGSRRDLHLGSSGRDTEASPTLLAAHATDQLASADPLLYRLLASDVRTQADTLSMLATASVAPPEVLAAAGSAIANVQANGFPGRRMNGGCASLDAVEQLAVERAKAVFGARYADVQPHSGSSANRSVYAGLLEPVDTVLALDSSWGGQREHGSPSAMSGRIYRTVSYGVNGIGRVDYELLADLARRCHPRLIVCSAGACPRTPDFARFRAIADEVGAYLLVDISLVAHLVAAGEHPNPIPHAHVVTCSTSTLGAAGGLILIGADAERPGPDGHGSLLRTLRASVYPLTQGAPNPAAIAAKAAALHWAEQPEFAMTARRGVADAKALASQLLAAGHNVLGHGTDNHAVWVNVASKGMTGVVAEHALESCHVFVSRNRVPNDVKPPQVASGIRLGTTVLAQRGITPGDVGRCANIVTTALAGVTARSDTEYHLAPDLRQHLLASVGALCRQFPLSRYGFSSASPDTFPVGA